MSKQPPRLRPNRTLNHPGTTHVVPTRSLAARMQREIARVNEIRRRSGECEVSQGEDDYGAKTYIAARAAQIQGRSTDESMMRQLRGILAQYTLATSAHFADILLAAVDKDIERDCPEILTLPAGRKAALDRVRINLELREAPEWFIDLYAEELADDLLEFAFAVILDGSAALNDTLVQLQPVTEEQLVLEAA